MSAPTETLAIPRLLHWEAQKTNQLYLTQPMGNGEVSEWTWGETLHEARCIAQHLRQLGKDKAWPTEAKIAILAKNCAWWLMADYAIWLAGYVSVPIYPNSSADYVRQVLDHSESQLCFVGKLDGWDTMKQGIPDTLPCIGMPLAPKNDYPQWNPIIKAGVRLADADLPTRKGSDLATLVYTSGTTGQPKGVMTSFDAIALAPIAHIQAFGVRENDRMLSYMPLAHVAERWIVEANSLQAGFQVFFAESLETFRHDLKRARPTVFIGVPRIWVKMQHGIFANVPKKKLDRLFSIPLLGRWFKRKILSELGLDTVRFAGCGAAPLPAEIIHWYRNLGLELLEGYGMSENFGCSHGSRLDTALVGSVGEPWHGVEHRIGELGEVQMRSPTLMLGYYKNSEGTAATFTPDGWLKTGDTGVIDGQNRLKIVGRLKEQFKTSKGKYVAPAPIENKIQQHEWVETVCVVGADYPQPFALLTLGPEKAQKRQEAAWKAEATQAFEQLLATVNQQVEPHERLDFLVVVAEQWDVENGFITPTLKVKRAAIESHYGAKFAGWAKARAGVIWG
jgi:long-chain acyl-CoA synthetase